MLLIGAALLSPGAQPRLAPTYAEWLAGPASYLITKTERQAFLNLKTDDQRDAFLERFWELRNPAPGSGHNEFREEFYRRLAHVNAFLGKDSGTEGWRTDRGRTYLLFGKPQSTTNFLHSQELFPVELWFYSNPGLSELPPFFYILFLDRDGVGGYRYYHPAVDGPEKLLRAGGTSRQAYQYLRNINTELARATLSLIPGEPVDTDTFGGSMASQSIIHAAQAYNQMPSYVALIAQRALRLERVSSRVQYDLARAGLLAFVAWEKGDPWVHWQLEIQDPTQPKAAGGRAEFRIRARLFAAGRLVLEREAAPRFSVPAGSEEALKARPFVYEDRIPVVEGTYRLTVTAENVAARRTYEATRDITVARPSDRAAVSEVLVVSRYEPDTRERPFHFGGIKFFPDPAGATMPGRGLRICYQVSVAEPRPDALDVEYVIGGGPARVRKTFEDKLSLRATDAFGSLMVGKTLSTDELQPGAYQLAVRVKDSRTGRIAARSVTFTVTDAAGETQPVVVSEGQADTPPRLAAMHYERALCWLAQGRSQEAVAALEASWNITQNPAVQGLLQHLRAAAGRSSR
ncbi:MAG TPA: GWxTD domain-containing protein [Bryobacteraceae bacterium]|nr:GWxTD domain-containing protein [Bryobacteraceae bacterium]